MLDITGCERLFHGERRLLNEVANRLEWMGITARVAIADTIGCAWAVAHHGVSTRSIVESGDEHEAITALPVAALRIEPDLVEGLQEIDCDRIGDLFALPRLELAARFGGDLTHRLDQVLGEAMEVLDPVRPRSPLRVERQRALVGVVESVADL